MKPFLVTAALALFATGSAGAAEFDFSGSVNMGLTGGTEPASGTPAPYIGIDASARLMFDIDGALTVGIVVPVRAEQ